MRIQGSVVVAGVLFFFVLLGFATTRSTWLDADGEDLDTASKNSDLIVSANVNEPAPAAPAAGPNTTAPSTERPSTQQASTKQAATRQASQQPTTQAASTTTLAAGSATRMSPPAPSLLEADEAASAGVGSCDDGARFERVFRDDFFGSAVNQTNWDLYDSPGHAGNGLRHPSAFSVAGGILTITASNQDGQVVSGGMSHEGSQQYGRYSFRVRTDVDPSKTMSGVVLTWPASQLHPRDGENNMYETLRHDESLTRNPFYTFIHKPFGSASDQERFVHRADASQWQTMTMDWTPDRITVTREGAAPQTVTETAADFVPDNPHILTIQLDALAPQIDTDVTMQVDWVEIYKYCGQ